MSNLSDTPFYTLELLMWHENWKEPIIRLGLTVEKEISGSSARTGSEHQL